MSKPVFENLFAFSGRRNRKSFILAIGAIALPLTSEIMLTQFLHPTWDSSEFYLDLCFFAIGPISFCCAIIAFISVAALSLQRCHDCNITGWLLTLLVFPVLGLGLGALLLVRKGTVGANRFGPDPLGCINPAIAAEVFN